MHWSDHSLLRTCLLIKEEQPQEDVQAIKSTTSVASHEPLVSEKRDHNCRLELCVTYHNAASDGQEEEHVRARSDQ